MSEEEDDDVLLSVEWDKQNLARTKQAVKNMAEEKENEYGGRVRKLST